MSYLTLGSNKSDQSDVTILTICNLLSYLTLASNQSDQSDVTILTICNLMSYLTLASNWSDQSDVLILTICNQISYLILASNVSDLSEFLPLLPKTRCHGILGNKLSDLSVSNLTRCHLLSTVTRCKLKSESNLTFCKLLSDTFLTQTTRAHGATHFRRSRTVFLV